MRMSSKPDEINNIKTLIMAFLYYGDDMDTNLHFLIDKYNKSEEYIYKLFEDLEFYTFFSKDVDGLHEVLDYLNLLKTIDKTKSKNFDQHVKTMFTTLKEKAMQGSIMRQESDAAAEGKIGERNSRGGGFMAPLRF